MAKKKIDSEDVDKEIIKEIQVALGKLGLSDLKQILSQYGKKDKELLRDELLQWNIDYKHEDQDEDIEDELDELLGEEEGRGKRKKKGKQKPLTTEWIEFADKAFNIHWIHRIDREDSYNFRWNHPEYKLIINKLEFAEGNKVQVMYANTEVIYKTKKDRDEAYESLKVKLFPFGIRFI